MILYNEAGGYHADTQNRYYVISFIMVVGGHFINSWIHERAKK